MISKSSLGHGGYYCVNGWALVILFSFVLDLDATMIPVQVSFAGDSVQRLIVGGDADGSPADSPSLRIDDNLTTSPYAGVGSFRIDSGSGYYLGSGSAITQRHIVTAAHLFDHDGNGTLDTLPSSVTFYLNYGGNLTHAYTASAINMHPLYTGTLHHDLAVVELTSSIPDTVPVYSLYNEAFDSVQTIIMVGYGMSGFGSTGFSSSYPASLNTKRWGLNQADDYYESPDVFVYDFDGPEGSKNYLGGTTLGNDLEGGLGPGDSGGPSFIVDNGQLLLFAVNTFGANFVDPDDPDYNPPPGSFTTAGGGTVLYYDRNWIGSTIPEGGIGCFVYGLVLLGLMGARRILREATVEMPQGQLMSGVEFSTSNNPNEIHEYDNNDDNVRLPVPCPQSRRKHIWRRPAQWSFDPC